MREGHSLRWKTIKKRFIQTLEKQIMQDSPQKVALGCAIGIGINFFPTLGLGFLCALLLAALFRANRTSAAVTSIITAPVVPLMYTLNLIIGGLILTPVVGHENPVDFLIYQYSIILRLGNIQEKIFGFLEFFGSTFLLGAAVNSAIVSTAFYFFIIYVFKNKINIR